jgi:hypothetical protein
MRIKLSHIALSSLHNSYSIKGSKTKPPASRVFFVYGELITFACRYSVREPFLQPVPTTLVVTWITFLSCHLV